MTPQEYNEYHAIERRVEYLSGVAPTPDKEMRDKLDLLIERGGPIAVPYPFPVKETSDVLFSYPELSKIFSVILDGLETLPYRPDITFDRWWAPFEVLLTLYAKEVWNMKGKIKTADLFRRFAEEVIRPEISNSKEGELQVKLQEWLGMIPVTVCRYATVRMLLDREIRAASQYEYVKERAKEAIGEDLFIAFEKEYLSEVEGEKALSATDHHRAARKLLRVLTDQPLTFNGASTPGITLERRLEFILTAILYASRCERLHGDYFSPFVSQKADFSLYPHWYWFCNTVYFLFLILLKRFIGYKDLPNPLSLPAIESYIQEVTRRYREAFLTKAKTE